MPMKPKAEHILNMPRIFESMFGLVQVQRDTTEDADDYNNEHVDEENTDDVDEDNTDDADDDKTDDADDDRRSSIEDAS